VRIWNKVHHYSPRQSLSFSSLRGNFTPTSHQTRRRGIKEERPTRLLKLISNSAEKEKSTGRKLKNWCQHQKHKPNLLEINTTETNRNPPKKKLNFNRSKDSLPVQIWRWSCKTNQSDSGKTGKDAAWMFCVRKRYEHVSGEEWIKCPLCCLLYW
jgi:hypothetical protein